MSGGTYLDYQLAFHVSSSHVYPIFLEILLTMQRVFRLSGLPKNEDELKQSAEELKFSRSFSSSWSGCVGALDGIAIKIKKPNNNAQPAVFYCRKGFYSITIQSIVNPKY